MSERKMKLGEVVAFLRAQDGATRVERGFGVAGSWRGNYSEVAFRPETGTTVAAMLMHAESVMGSTITGYKGGDYWVDKHTPCNVAEWGCYDETDGLTLERLCAMCSVQPELEQVKAERDNALMHNRQLTMCVEDLRRQLVELEGERDHLRQWYLAVDAEAVMIGIAVEPTDDAKAALGRVLDWHVKVALDPLVSADARALRDTYLEERDRLAVEVAELKHLLVVAAADLRAFTTGAGELYALGGEIQDAAVKHLPCGNGPFDRAAAKHIGNIGWQEEER